MNKKLSLLLLLLCLHFYLQAQMKTMYVAHKPGLSIREKPDVKAKVLDKIPYAAKVQFDAGMESADTVQVKTDGMSGTFRKVTYNGKTGYIIDCYLFPAVPPKANVKTLADYLLQLSPKFGAELLVKSGNMNYITEGGYEQKKQLYKNGAERHLYSAYEYGSETCFIPNFTIQQAYLLMRLIPDFKNVVTEKEEFPADNKKYTKNNTEYDVKVDRDAWNNGLDYRVKRIHIEYSDGAYYFIDIYQHENDAVIFWGSGV
jgi:hypothetical protein